MIWEVHTVFFRQWFGKTIYHIQVLIVSERIIDMIFESFFKTSLLSVLFHSGTDGGISAGLLHPILGIYQPGAYA